MASGTEKANEEEIGWSCWEMRWPKGVVMETIAAEIVPRGWAQSGRRAITDRNGDAQRLRAGVVGNAANRANIDEAA
jgi:hypothetical protein